MGKFMDFVKADGISQSAGALGTVSGVVGGLLANTRRKQQYGDQVKLMGIQQANQMALNRQMQEIEMENWEKTNYDAQRKQMEKAGLNPALMYGGQGGGSMVMDSGTGGSATSGNAPIPENGLGAMGIGLMQASQIQSQVELNKAMANKANAEAEKTAGVDTEVAGANKALTEMNTRNATLENQLKSQGLEATLDTLEANRDKAVAESSSAITNANVSASTKESQINKINSEAVNEAFKLTLMEADRNLTNEKARAVTQELAQEWERLSIELDKVGIGKMQNAINEFTAKINARLGTQNLEMRRIEAGLNATGKMLNKGVNIDKSGSKTTINNY